MEHPGAGNVNNLSVILVQFVSSQNVSFYISLTLTSMRPIHSIEFLKKIFIYLYFKRIDGLN